MSGRPNQHITLRALPRTCKQVRDLGRGALLVGGAADAAKAVAAGGSAPAGTPQGAALKKELEEWSRSSLDIMEDPSGATTVKELTYIEV